MTSDDLCLASTVHLAARIRAKEVSPREVAQAYLGRIEALDPHVHAYLHVAADHALEAARRAEAALMRGAPLGPLHGVPVAVKDLFDTAGIPTTCGSPRILRGNVPARSATAVERLEAAGAVLLGKLHLTEFAYVAHHPDTPPARNPWALDRSPGGSSSGSAIAVACGLASATLGTDTVASIRLPAAWCGVVGLKPTWGRVSRDGVFPLAASLDHVGPIARSVADAALLLHCIAGPDERDASTRLDPPPSAEPAPRESLRGLRVGWDDGYATADVHPAMAAAARAARDRMAALGATLVPVALPAVERVLPLFYAVFATEVRAAHARHYPARADDYGPSLRDSLGAFASLDPHAHVEGALGARAFRHRIDRLFHAIDVFLCPAWPFPATRLRGDERDIAMEGGEGRNPLFAARFTCLWNLAATPAVSLPWGTDADGLPLAVQLVARVGADEALLSVAARLEAEAPASGRRPPFTR
jgi:amidase